MEKREHKHKAADYYCTTTITGKRNLGNQGNNVGNMRIPQKASSLSYK